MSDENPLEDLAVTLDDVRNNFALAKGLSTFLFEQKTDLGENPTLSSCLVAMGTSVGMMLCSLQLDDDVLAEYVAQFADSAFLAKLLSEKFQELADAEAQGTA